MFKKIAVFLSVLMLAACEPEPINLYFGEPDEENAGGEEGLTFVDMPLVLDVEAGGEDPSEQTKATVLADAELVSSGALVLVYHDGRLVSYEYFTREQIVGQGLSPLKVSAPLTTCNFYILGNLNVIRKSDGTRLNLMEAYGASFPVVESDLRAVSYRLDGGDLFPGSPLRREKMSEVAVYGIPYQKVIEDVDVASCVSTGLPGANQCVRLFSKVSLTIDHAALDGGGAHPGYFVNKKVIVRQVNCRLQPFSTDAVKAQSSEDILAPASATDPGAFADYDLDMTGYSGSRVTVNLYVPENMQGNLLSGNTSNLLKTPANVPAQYKDYVTYVEYQGSVSEQAGGYGADVTYQFCLGGDALNNFDLRRGCRYSVTLGFSVTNIFAQPAWKVGVSGWSDSRNFRLTADSAYSTTLPDAQMVAVRANRPGTVYVYSSRSGYSANALENGSVVDPGYAPVSLADCAWTSDFMSGTNAPADVPSRQWLLDRGITPYWNRTAGDKAKLEFVVTDATKFGAHVGEEKELTLTLLPGDGGKTVTLKVKLYPNLSVTWDKSLTDGFMPGMKRTATVVGFSGEVMYAYADAHTLKNVRTPGSTGLILPSFSSAQKTGNGTLPVWMYFDCMPGRSFDFTFRPVDTFNDGGDIVFPVVAERPFILLSTSTPTGKWTLNKTRVNLEVTGKEETVSFTVRRGGYNGDLVPITEFDAECFADVYTPAVTYKTAVVDVPTEEGSSDMSFVINDSEFLGFTPKGTVNASGYPEYSLYRKKIGTEYDIRANADVKLRDCAVAFVPEVSDWRGTSGVRRHVEALDARLLPFVSVGNDVGFPDKLHDFTLTPDSDKFDAPYKDYASTTASSTDATFYCSDRTAFELYAVPQNAYSFNYNEPSESVVISQAVDGGPVLLNFVETGSNKHSAGPHKVYAKVTNKHSGETLEALLDSFEVYVDFVCGVVYQSLSRFDETTCYATFLNGDGYFGRTSCDASLVSVLGKMKNIPSFSYTDVFGNGFGSTAHSIGGIRLDPCVGQVSPNYPSAYGQLYSVSFSVSSGTYPIEYYRDIIVGNSGGCARLAKEGHGEARMVFTDMAPYTNEFSELHIRYIDLVDDDGKGYYVLHWLGDVCSSSYGWINVFYDFN